MFTSNLELTQVAEIAAAVTVTETNTLGLMLVYQGRSIGAS